MKNNNKIKNNKIKKIIIINNHKNLMKKFQILRKENKFKKF